MTFPDYENFSYVNEAYSDVASTIFEVINKVAPTKSIRVNNNTNEWFDDKIAEKVGAQYKLFWI